MGEIPSFSEPLHEGTEEKLLERLHTIVQTKGYSIGKEGSSMASFISEEKSLLIGFITNPIEQLEDAENEIAFVVFNERRDQPFNNVITHYHFFKDKRAFMKTTFRRKRTSVALEQEPDKNPIVTYREKKIMREPDGVYLLEALSPDNLKALITYK